MVALFNVRCIINVRANRVIAFRFVCFFQLSLTGSWSAQALRVNKKTLWWMRAEVRSESVKEEERLFVTSYVWSSPRRSILGSTDRSRRWDYRCRCWCTHRPQHRLYQTFHWDTLPGRMHTHKHVQLCHYKNIKYNSV